MDRKTEIEKRMGEITELLTGDQEVNIDELETEVRSLKDELKEIEQRSKREAMAKEIQDGKTEVRTIEQPKEEIKVNEIDKRGKDLAEKRAVTVSSGDIVTPTHDKGTIKESFNQVSTLLDRVSVVPLDGGESYEAPFEIEHGEGNYTEEGQPYFDTTVEFGYASINKTKITAYNEITEEVLKLPRADYAGRVEGSVGKALRKKITKEILVGSGQAGEFTGIFSANATAINPATDLEIGDIDKDTLDDIIYAYGGDEDVEDEAVLILSKHDLRKFAAVRDDNGRKYYDIVNNGNTGRINGVQYVINSAAGSLSTADDGDYLMAYGPLSAYEMAVFSPTELKRSDDVKFKEGMIAHRGSVFAGGNVVKFNGFLRVKKAPTV
ncbi:MULTISPECIES: phage major capsid protein [Bacillaceae]|uniref:Phage major capsid protein n=1 Tax=Evansella alkalicola TaxID=745819 RepID=A0ABS6JZV2_9BACI|nr:MULTISPECIES: phage major capsid protein [Bacillaceae]MBU9724130.1 phage major capsid protein [Bacillus alkalicola]